MPNTACRQHEKDWLCRENTTYALLLATAFVKESVPMASVFRQRCRPRRLREIGSVSFSFRAQQSVPLRRRLKMPCHKNLWSVLQRNSVHAGPHTRYLPKA